MQYLKGKSSYRLQREFRELQKQYWGQHLWGRGYFGATVGAVTEEQVKRYIEEQDEGSGAFQVWDESPRRNELQADSSAARTDFSLKGRLRP